MGERGEAEGGRFGLVELGFFFSLLGNVGEWKGKGIDRFLGFRLFKMVVERDREVENKMVLMKVLTFFMISVCRIVRKSFFKPGGKNR